MGKDRYVGFNQPAYCLHCSSEIESPKFPYCDKQHRGLFEEGMRQYFEMTLTAPSVGGVLERMGENPGQTLDMQRRTMLEGVVVDLKNKVISRGYRIKGGRLVAA